MNAKAYFACLLLFFFVSACANYVRKGAVFETPDSASNTASLIATLNQRNESLHSVKGIGKIKLWGEKGVQVSRLAWLGAPVGGDLGLVECSDHVQKERATVACAGPLRICVLPGHPIQASSQPASCSAK